MQKQLSFKIDPEPIDPNELTKFIRKQDKQKDREFELQYVIHSRQILFVCILIGRINFIYMCIYRMQEINENEDVFEEPDEGDDNNKKDKETTKRANLKKMLLFSILL